MNRFIVFILSVAITLALGAAPALGEEGVPTETRSVEHANSLLRTAQIMALGSDEDPAVDEIVGNIIGVALSMVGLIFIVLIIYGGYLWGTARGNEERVERGKKLILEAVIGLIIIFGAYFVTAFVVDNIGEAILEQ